MCHFRLQSVKHEAFLKMKTEAIISNGQNNIYKIVFACQKGRLFVKFGCVLISNFSPRNRFKC